MRHSLEDDFNDILQKAIQGLSLSLPQLEAASGVSARDLEQLFLGHLNEEHLLKVAPVLALNPEKLCAIGKNAWYPQPHAISGLTQISSFYGDMEVNAYLIHIPETQEAILFDTGTDASSIEENLTKHSLTLRAIFLTHTHSDHVAVLDHFLAKQDQPAVYTSTKEPISGTNQLDHKDVVKFKALSIESRLTSGHSPGGMTYVIKGLSPERVAIVGDALFAGSMGRGLFSYKEAIQSNRREILSLPKSTILCPGHGPMTSVEEEIKHNPFF